MANYLKRLTSNISKSSSKKSTSKKSNTSNSTNATTYTSSSKSQNATSKQLKSLSTSAKITIIFFLVVGFIVSFFTCKFICRNDCFEINGAKSISISVGDSYYDKGANVVAFGKNIENKLEVSVYKNNEKLSSLNDIDTSEEATYQIVYKVNSFRFRDVKLIRIVTVVAQESVTPEDSYTD